MCCAAQVTPFLFEYSADDSQFAKNIGRTIANEIIDSDIFLVILSPSVSKAFWTQAWIGFEIGVSIGAAIASDGTSNNFTGRIIVLQDIQQDIKVSVPEVNVLFLYDFGRSWDDAQELLQFISVYMDGSTGEVYHLGNELRERMMTGRALCGNDTCESVYDVVIPFKDTEKLESKVWCNDVSLRRLQWIKRGVHAKSTLKCPSCGKKVECELTRSK